MKTNAEIQTIYTNKTMYDNTINADQTQIKLLIISQIKTN